MEPSKSPPLKQPNELTVLMPRIGKLTGVGRKLHVSLMRSAQVQLRALSAQDKDLKATEFFKAPLSEIIRPISKPDSNLIELTKVYVDQMQSTKVAWTAPEGTKEGVIWDQMVLVTQAKISIEDGRLWLYWGFPQDVVSVLTDPQSDYTLTQPEDLKELNGYTAISLYIIASRYRNNPSHSTCIRPTAWWIEALRGDSKKTSSRDKTEVKLPPWRKFKSEKVIAAIDEINKKSPLYIEIVEIKQGQAVKDVQFKVWQKSQFKPQSLATPLHIQATALGIPQEEITNHLRSGYTEGDLSLILARISARKENERLPRLDNVLAYFRDEIRRREPIALPANNSRAEAKKTARQPGRASQKNLFEQEGRAQQEITPRVALSASTSAEFDPPITPADLLFEELTLASTNVIDDVLREVRAELAARNILTAVLSKRLNEKNWRSGTLKAHAIECYAAKTYGPDWRQAIALKMNSLQQSAP